MTEDQIKVEIKTNQHYVEQAKVATAGWHKLLETTVKDTEVYNLILSKIKDSDTQKDKHTGEVERLQKLLGQPKSTNPKESEGGSGWILMFILFIFFIMVSSPKSQQNAITTDTDKLSLPPKSQSLDRIKM